MRATTLLCGSFLVAALLLTACGGREGAAELPGSPAAASPTPLSSEEICAMAMADFDNVGPAPMSPDIAAIACEDHRMELGELVTQASALCADAGALHEAISETDQLERLAREADIDEVKLMNFEALTALAPLPEAAEPLTAAIEALSRTVELREGAHAAATAGDASELQRLVEEIRASESEFADLADSVGIEGCT